VLIQKIRKEEKLKYKENNKKFDEDDQPQAFSDSHILKAFVIKLIKPDYVLPNKGNHKVYLIFESDTAI
jgi:hypothetical protein